MPKTIKISQFTNGGNLATGDIVTGLNSIPGTNTNWTFTGGSGGSGGVTFTIMQSQTLAVGNWVEINSSGVYVKAQADSAGDAEVIGIVIASPATGLPANQYTIQQSGYIQTSQNVFSGLIAGDPYFLDTATAGNMVAIDATVNNQVSRPVFVADTATSGWVVPYRGMIVGGVASSSSGGNSPTPDIVTVNQNAHGFIVGNWVKVILPNLIHGQPNYALAQADNLADAQAVGVVITINSVNQFVLQFAGYNIGAVTLDSSGNPVVPPTVYYLDPTHAGQITSTNPSTIGQISKPVYICEQTGSGPQSTGTYAGYILPQRPIDLNESDPSGVIHTVTQANSFNVGQWVYIQSDTTYALAQANTLATSQVAGMVIEATVNNFIVQQAGWNTGSVTGTYVDSAFTSGQVLYLSPTIAGNVTPTKPTSVGQVVKPCYVQETASTHIGEILPQVPLLITAPPSGNSAFQLIQTFTLTGSQTVLDTTSTFLNGTYTDVKIIGRDIFVNNVGSTNSATIGFRYYSNGILLTSGYYTAATNIGNYITLNGSIGSTGTVVTAAGNGMNFEINTKSVNTTNNYKTFSGSTQFFDPSLSPDASFIEFAAPTGLIVNNTAPSFSTARLASNSTNTQDITGFYFYFPLGSQFFVSGQISIYGITS